MMRKLTAKEIEDLANIPKVKKVAVENFLMSMGEDFDTAIGNLDIDAKSYKWNIDTVQAILTGIWTASGSTSEECEIVSYVQRNMEPQ